MLIHHFYPRTQNIGDHFVQRGISTMIRRLVPDASFQLFDVNSRGRDKSAYGLTQSAIERANDEADLVIVGGSNLYEGGFGWPWGVHLDPAALKQLRVPLCLLGIGTGSRFASALHKPSTRAKREITLLNELATLSGARDVVTLDWLKELGVTNAKLMGDPATFIFNHPLQTNTTGRILVVFAPSRIASSKRQPWKARIRGGAVFRALAELTRNLLEQGQKVIVACNDPSDLPLAQQYFSGWLPDGVTCPQTPEEYFRLLSASRAVISGRLHTAVVALSLGIPFLLIDVDGRTSGFVKTYHLERWAVSASDAGIAKRLCDQTSRLLRADESATWPSLIERRNQMESVAMNHLQEALDSILKKVRHV
jgi:polysaccharide pyruvyl transferase WcaK-like protein